MEETNGNIRNLVLSVCDLKQIGDVPSSRVGAQVITVATRLYLHGGADDKIAYGNLYMMEIEKSSWRELTVGGFSKPSGRYGHSLTACEDRLVLFGGLAATEQQTLLLDDPIRNSYPAPSFMGAQARPWTHKGTPSNQLFTLQTDSLVWTEADSPNKPSPRSFHAAAIVKKHLLIHGGAPDETISSGLNDLHVLNLQTMLWLTVNQTGQLPTPRFAHKMVYCSKKDCIFMFGGADDDGALFSLDTSAITEQGVGDLCWSRVETSNTPPLARSFHTVDLIGDRLFVFAGQTLSDVSDLYIYEINKNKWSRPLYDGQINVKTHASTVLHDKLIIFGGARERSDITATSALGWGGGIGLRSGNASSILDDETSGNAKTGWISSSSKSQRISKKLFFINVLEIKEGGGEGDLKFKLVVVGDSGVGKSCLLTRFVQDIYSEFHVSTIGVDFKSVVTMIKGKLVTLQLWDTAGQERFGGVTGNYYRNADGFVLTYDATRKDSFDHIDNWIKQIQEHHECGPSTLKLLIGNKSDLHDSLEVTSEDAIAMADRIGAIYVAASAKTASNVDAAFLSAANKLVDMRRRANQQRNTAPSISGGRDPSRVTLGGFGNSQGGASQTQNVGGCGGCTSGGGGGG